MKLMFFWRAAARVLRVGSPVLVSIASYVGVLFACVSAFVRVNVLSCGVSSLVCVFSLPTNHPSPSLR